MDHYEHDHYDPDLTSGSDGSVLGTTIRNVVILVAACLGVAWAFNGFDGFSGGSAGLTTASPGNRYDRQIGESDEDADPDGPVQQLARGYSEIVVPPGPRGHFIVVAAINGVDVEFLVDTGASTVVLTEEDARRVGFPPNALDYSAISRTANGDIAIAPVTLRQVQLQDLEIVDVEGTVTRAPLHISLLGMSFLSRLSGYEVRGDGLVLRY